MIPWEHDKELYKRRNEVERLLHSIFTRYDKLDVLFVGFILRSLIFSLRVNTPKIRHFIYL